jgi:3-dehydroquinate dehydratase-1
MPIGRKSAVRLQSKIKVAVRQKIIGGVRPLVCVPLLAAQKTDLIDQAKRLRSLSPDLFEWRVDSYDKAADPADCLATLGDLRAIIGDTPLIFTCRIAAEGGMQSIDAQTRLTLIDAAIASAVPDIVDIELCNPPAFIQAVQAAAARNGVRLILSYHDFAHTPEAADILGKLEQAQTQGADIAKVAVMPNDYKDVLTLLNATLKARSTTVKIPIVTMAMGQMGAVTRLAGGLFGSDITFAIGDASSAPGQIPIDRLRQAMAPLYDR